MTATRAPSASSTGRRLRVPAGLRPRLADLIRTSPTGLVVLAIATGLGAGLGAVAFRYLILWFTKVFSGHADYSAAVGEAHPWVPWLGSWFVVLAPVAAGLLYGPLIQLFAREARGHGVPEVMLAVAERGGRIRPQVAVVKSLASALCIGGGGSVGREGPIVQIGSALGSTLGQLLRLPEPRLKLVLACGAAGGVSATFNAPIAGVLFALELILANFEAESFGVVVLASVAASVVGRAAFGSAAFMSLPPFAVGSLTDYGLYAALGLVAALVGVVFIRVLYGLEDLADWAWRGPEWLRPVAGGLVLGLLLLVVPEMYGVGYPVLEAAIRESYAVKLLVLFMVGKILATSLTIAIGGSGGVFAPSLFIGAMLGTAYGTVVHGLWPQLTGSAGAYGLVGMGALFAAVSRAPMSAVIIIFELTGEYQIILPLMFAIALSTGIGALLSRDTIYTLKLWRRGIDLSRARRPLMQVLTVGEAMSAIPEGVEQGRRLDDVVARFSDNGTQALPVLDGQGRYRGTVLGREVERSLRDDAGGVTMGDLARDVPTLRPEQTLEQALGVLVATEAPGLPVLSADGRAVVGWLSHGDVLRLYHARSAARPAGQRA
jgi:chloride channel protein, CIC family